MRPKAAKLIRAAQTVMGVSALAILCWSTYEVVLYLRTTPRFDVRKLSVVGIQHVQESQVLAKGGFEVGTNSFRVDLDEVRQRVEELDWVRYASVQRVFPDQIVIKI